MAQRKKRNTSQLGDSWVVNDASSDSGDESANSYREEGEEEEVVVNTPRRKTKNSPGKKRRSSRAASKEPEFVMPSIHEDGMARSRDRLGGGGGGRNSEMRDRKAKGRVRSKGQGGVWEEPALFRSSRTAASQQQADGNNFNLADGILAFMKEVLMWMLDVIVGAAKALRTPISYAIALYVFLGLIAVLRNLLTNSIYTALSPICRIPGSSSLLHLPMCQTTVQQDYGDDANGPVEFDQLMTVQSKFEDILEQSAAGVSLPLDMKRGETSIRDLRQIVRFSHLPSRNELVLEFDGFIETARMASYDLQKFNSHVGRSVDNVLSTARWTRRVLDDISTRQASRGLIPAFINDKLLAPFQPVTKPTPETALLDQYIQHTRIVEEEINRLISEAQALLSVLTNLEDRLEVIHSISLRDNIHAQGSKDEILTHLWTLLGGNRIALGKYNSQLLLLRHVTDYRKTAWAHVTGTVVRLQAMGAELEGLRERVGGVEVLSSIGSSVPLSVHIENIELGVARLEECRGAARRLEHEQLRRVIDRNNDEGNGNGNGIEGVRMVEG